MRAFIRDAPEELYLLVNAETGELGDAVLYDLIGKYIKPGFRPVRYLQVKRRKRMSRPRAQGRTRNGIRERLCQKCKSWTRLTLMCKSKLCAEGRTNECRACRNERRALVALATKEAESIQQFERRMGWAEERE